MKPIIRVLVVCLFVLSSCTASADGFASGEEGRADRVTGPLSFILLTAEGELEVRLAELDSPDDSRARAELEALVSGREIRLAYGGLRRDRYGRALAQVYVVDEAGEADWLQARLVRTGAVRVLTYADNHAASATLLALEAEARAAGTGLWGEPEFRVRDTHPDALAQDQGSVQLVEGRVLSATRLDNGRVYLNFGADWRSDFTVMIEADAAPQFEAAGVDPVSLESYRIRVRGYLALENGPMIRIDHPHRIERLEE